MKEKRKKRIIRKGERKKKKEKGKKNLQPSSRLRLPSHTPQAFRWGGGLKIGTEKKRRGSSGRVSCTMRKKKL